MVAVTGRVCAGDGYGHCFGLWQTYVTCLQLLSTRLGGTGGECGGEDGGELREAALHEDSLR